jgi:orotidine-5'-phosphate decarboxylase
MEARDRLIVAIDVDEVSKAEALIARLTGCARSVKIGKQLFVAGGPEFVKRLVAGKFAVFLDLKFHDIPATVAGATREAVKLGVAFIDLHASGGRAMMRAAREAAEDQAARQSAPRPRLLGVTVLTSLAGEALSETGVSGGVEKQVTRLAGLALEAGLDGVVCSPREISEIRKTCGEDFLVVTPGIRSGDEPADDQRRTLSARKAIEAGADYLVVGRPITSAADPASAFEKLAAEIEAGAGLKA